MSARSISVLVALGALGALPVGCVLPAYEVGGAGGATASSTSASGGGGDASGGGGAASTGGGGAGGAAPERVILAKDLCDVGAVAVQGGDVFYVEKATSATDAKIVRVSLDSTSPIPEAVLSGLDHPNDLAVDPTYLFWSQGAGVPGAVMRSTRDGTMSAPMQPGLPGAGAIALDGSYVYWIVPGNGGAIQRMDKSGGSLTYVVSTLFGPKDVVVDDTYVYWTETGMGDGAGLVRRALKDETDTEVVTLATGQQLPGEVSVQGDRVYWTNGQGSDVVSACSTQPGGNSAPVVDGAARPSDLVVDADRLYFFESAKELHAQSIAGGEDVVLDDAIQVAGALADTGDALVYTDLGVDPCQGVLYRIAKP
jgi:hypothetical protein